LFNAGVLGRVSGQGGCQGRQVGEGLVVLLHLASNPGPNGLVLGCGESLAKRYQCSQAKN
jgi:hypothetical protein